MIKSREDLAAHLSSPASRVAAGGKEPWRGTDPRHFCRDAAGFQKFSTAERVKVRPAASTAFTRTESG